MRNRLRLNSKPKKPHEDGHHRKGFRDPIVGDMTAQGLWIAGYPTDYDRGYAIDLHQLRAFVEATQPPLVEALDYRLGFPDWPA